MGTETSKALQNLFYQYTHLPIGGKEIVCPYWMNNLEKGIYGPIGGKGTPKQIEDVTAAEAEKEKIDLSKMNAEKIVLFMRMKRIGVDCSGFVFWMLNALDLEKGGNGIGDDIPGNRGKVVEYRANARILTDDKVSFPVNSVSEIKPGDIIRMRRGKHVAVILSIFYEKDKIFKLEYAHSSGNVHTKLSGVHKAEINIIDQDRGLELQEWLEEVNQGKKYNQFLFPQEADGVKRLNIWG